MIIAGHVENKSRTALQVCLLIKSPIWNFCTFRLKSHYRSYEPTLRQLKHKYELAMKEKMLTKLERDRVAGQVGLTSELKYDNNG